jgi:SNF2 family DNA or RNA helicase
MTGLLHGEVTSSDLLDELVITPTEWGNRHQLAGALRKASPTVTFKRFPGGVKVDSFDGETLWRCPPEGVSLRWSEEAKQVARNRAWVKEVHSDLLRQVEELKEQGRPLAEEWLSDVGGLEVLDDHQWVNVAAMTLPGGYGLSVFDEQGAGKTVTFLFAFDVLAERDETDFALILAPKSMVSEWPQDIRRFKGDLYRVQVATGGRQEKLKAIGARPEVLVTNFESAVSMEAELSALARSYGGRAVLAVDESFFVKNQEAQRTAAVRRLREWFGRAYVLCGTPAPNGPQDLVQQFSIVDFGMTFHGVSLPRERDLASPIVQQAVETRGLYIRNVKAEVLPDLPRKTFHRVSVPMPEAQSELYRVVLDDLEDSLKGADEERFQRERTSFLAKRSALLQVCSNPGAVDEDYLPGGEIPAKLSALDGLLEDLIEQRREKVVLWSFYTRSIDSLVERYSRYNPVRYDGRVVSQEDRREAVRSFQEDSDVRLFVGNPAAAGAGLTLHSAHFAVYESMSNQAAHYLQSLDRIHRRGQKNEVQYIVLVCEGTLEETEYDRLLGKQEEAQHLFRDPDDHSSSRTVMLSEVEEAKELLERARTRGGQSE